ncbi:hypothetical protein [Planktothrix sp. FACHB-1365]|uniref:hypothetical protein n=1 Tax=Planktothrix sp. FACHB-1365 TaxID=2692855 RepID=UPI001683FC8E|nr:hypothetical protein [Planktothrix sp. FACHB-1365]MBD2485829.1 hypothetical protein [Planktothrix sp. FACHB-1365]
MQALTAIAATAYALTLWMFAPRTVWERELATAKRNQQNRLIVTTESKTVQPEQQKPETIDTSEPELKSITKAIPEATPQLDATPEATEEQEAIAQPSEPTPEPITETKEPTPQPEHLEEQPQPEVEPEPESIPEAREQAIPTPQGTDYTGWTTAQLREEAKSRKLQWRPLINGKRKPLNKPQLIELLTA